ncbi:putative hydrolase [Pseudooceanicola batsensis HTCC2597]|uniref:Putative hydrolase n=1 Tax=Pseudooceanicola batsensis (strain ATCC BAA-863 / DSM 15984 / KCTC 12145 / HTCC2597) TaxID=252305 RepID=A3U0P4_PSEBH|nr:alpha/beta hydrolase [Pseudooceanicola batsensis]EAQ02335.1 putative hydrolase [Pseudooceanicola batsensis HTCC2597]
MTGPRFSFVPVMDHEIHVTEWGDPTAEPLVMWHGLARTGRDFDEIAEALSDRYFVICPDTIGRGLSTWSQDPEGEYCVEVYAGIAVDLMDHYGMERAAWLGTSLGGLIGMRLASGPHADRLSCLLINDIGPEVPQEAIDRIVTYVTDQPVFARVREAETWLRAVYRPFGPADDAFWRRMARTSVRRLPDGGLTLHYDPQITVQFTASADELTSWDRYARIALPCHVLRGHDSDILPAGIADRMASSGPAPGVTEFDCGHAPNISRPQDIALVRGILADMLGTG